MFIKASIFRALSVLLVGLVLFAGVALPVNVRADSMITVDTTDDELNSDGDCSLREAIQAANSNAAVDACTAGSGVDTITVPAGTYILTIAGAGEDLNATGDLDITDSVTINGAGMDATLILAGLDLVEWVRIDRVLHILPGIIASISGVKIGPGECQGSGGGILNSSALTLTNVTLYDNITMGSGGGMYNSGSNTTLTNVIFSGNQGEGGAGGMYNSADNVTLTNVTFKSNWSWGTGGMSNSGSDITLTNVTFTSNSAYGTGGMSNSGSNVTLTNVTFRGNSSETNSGGMSNSGSSTTLTNVTFRDNYAEDTGGGMSNSVGNPEIRNTIFWNNWAPVGAQINNVSGAPVVSDSVVQGGYVGGTNILTGDPMLGTLGDYGGFTQTIPLLPGSSAIDATSNNCPATDQRGVARGSTCDIGSFESQGFALTKTGGDVQSTRVNTAFANPLTLDVTSAYGEPVDGGRITLNAPGSGASTNPSQYTATITGGAVSQSVTANGIGGSYNVTASANGAAGTVTFLLTNTKYVQLARNGGFENYVGVSKIPANWAAGYFSALDGKYPFPKTGIYSVVIKGAPGKVKTLTQTLNLSGAIGDAFIFSYWVKASQLPEAGQCLAQVLFYDGTTLMGTKTLKCPAGATYDWKQAKMNFTAPAAYNKVLIRFRYSKAGGTVWFDLVSLLR